MGGDNPMGAEGNVMINKLHPGGAAGSVTIRGAGTVGITGPKARMTEQEQSLALLLYPLPL